MILSYFIYYSKLTLMSELMCIKLRSKVEARMLNYFVQKRKNCLVLLLTLL